MTTRFKTIVLPLLCGLILTLTAHAAPHAPMLATVDDGKTDIVGWWMSEKLDGVRGYWDGTTLWSKSGQRLSPPVAFTQGLPDFALEGELWGGRGAFEETASTVARAQPHDGWLKLRFAVFDVPGEPGSFAARIARAQSYFIAHPSPYALVIEQLPIRDRAHLQQELQRIVALGGEGLMARNPEAPYAAGRSRAILKVKAWDDAEATVVAHLPGQGANVGKLGALLVETADGRRFRIGTGFSAAERETPPPVGATITYKYFGLTDQGLPRFPSYLRRRFDPDR